jgi:AcrR family transcriptional regulator
MHNKDKIVAAATALFEESGREALSVRAVAQRAGLSTIGIYSHFKGKQGLLNALYINGCELMLSKIEDVTGKTDSDKILDASERLLEFSVSNRAYYRLVFNPAAHECNTSEEAAKAFDRVTHSLSLLTLPLHKKCPSPDKSKTSASHIWALIHGFVSLNDTGIFDNSSFKSTSAAHRPVYSATDSNNMDTVQWKERALNAIRLHVYAIAATQ